jgi:hypothetical protein
MKRFPNALTLAQFILRKEVLDSYKKFMVLTRNLKEVDRIYYRQMIREDYKGNKDKKEVKHYLQYANQQLRILETNLTMSK